MNAFSPHRLRALAELGVEFTTDAAWSGTAYVDSVTCLRRGADTDQRRRQHKN
ncbi:MAG TPA: hypothetical protein VGK73_40160 [Polyangiaceae bacterium]